MIEQLINTNNFSTIEAICTHAHKYSKMVSIIGYPGSGKTTALEHYCENNKNVHYISVSASMSTNDFHSKLLNILGVEGKSLGKNLHDLINQVCYKLNYSQERQLLIIDEAGKFKPRFLELLHEVRDNTSKTTGIILAGPEYFQENLQKWKNQGVIGVPELFRRIQHWEHLLPPTKNEVATLCKVNGIEDKIFIKDVQKNYCENFAQIIYAIQAYKLKQFLNNTE